MEIIQSEQQTERQIKENKNNTRELLDNITLANLHIIGIPEGEEKEKDIKNVFEEIMTENFPHWKKKTDICVWEAQRVPQKMNPNRPITRHIVIKMAKVKERILKSAREKIIISKEPPKGYQLISLQKQCRPEGSARYIQRPEMQKPAT